MTSFQMLSLLVPILSAAFVGILTFQYALKSKKFDLLYASKIPAFKEIASKLTSYKIYCLGKHSVIVGNEFSPYFNEPGTALFHRTEIAHVSELNAIFLSSNTRNALYKFLGDMSLLCNLELHAASDEDIPDYSGVYENAAKKVEALIEIIYKDLNLT